MGVAVYYRFTTRAKAREQEPYQTREISQYLDEHALETDQVFRDEPCSGWRPIVERPEGSRLLNACDSGKISTVVVYNPDTLGTSSDILMGALLLLRNRGVTIRFVHRWDFVDEMIALIDRTATNSNRETQPQPQQEPEESADNPWLPERQAAHAAGVALLAILFGRQVGLVSIAEEDANGGLWMVHTGAWPDWDQILWDRRYHWLSYLDAVTRVGGRCAEDILVGSFWTDSMDEERLDIHESLREMLGLNGKEADEARDGDWEEELEPWFEQAFGYLHQLLTVERQALKALADMLLQKERLYGEEVHGILATHDCEIRRQIEPEWADTPEGHMMLLEYRAANSEGAEGNEEG